MPRLIVFSGAGLSAGSGMATFRGSGGLWNGHRVEEVCDLRTWKANYEAVHAFYDGLRTALAGHEPNAAHLAVARWQARYDAINITTNVDDLLERAGCHDVIHLHGSLLAMRCTACDSRWPIGHRAWEKGSRCARGRICTSIRSVKPDVVFFHEQAPLYRYLEAAVHSLREDDVVLVIGSSGLVVRIQDMLEGRPGYHMLVNLEPIPGGSSVFDHALYGSAVSAVPEVERILVERLGPGRTQGKAVRV